MGKAFCHSIVQVEEVDACGNFVVCLCCFCGSEEIEKLGEEGDGMCENFDYFLIKIFTSH